MISAEVDNINGLTHLNDPVYDDSWQYDSYDSLNISVDGVNCQVN